MQKNTHIYKETKFDEILKTNFKKLENIKIGYEKINQTNFDQYFEIVDQIELLIYHIYEKLNTIENLLIVS